MFTSSCARFVGALTAGLAGSALQAQVPSDGPAVGLPVAINSRDAQGNPTALLHFKQPGLQQMAAEPVTVALDGPGAPLATAAALHWASPSWQVQSAGGPGAEFGHLLVHDPIQGTLWLLNPAGMMRRWTGSAWTGPMFTWPMRRHGAAVPDPATGTVLLFGGRNSSGNLLNDTQRWDGASSTWGPMSPASVPAARERHAMAYDATTNLAIMFGGVGSAGSFGDTWTWNGVTGTWTQVASSGPSARNGHAMAYDALRGRIVLFGGIAGTTVHNDTWEWHAGSWTQQAPTASPPARHRHRMVYDQARQRIMIHGGRPSLASVAAFNETWEYDGSQWCETQRSPTMPGRNDHAMAFDPVSNTTVVHGGTSPTVTLGDTWTRDQSSEPLGINDFSLGLDWIPAHASTPGLVDVPTESWIGMAFSVREGAIGRPGSRLALETPSGIGSDLFTYVFHGSDPVCLPGHAVGDVTRAANSSEGLVGGATPPDINGLDVFLPAYRNGPNYTGNPLPQNVSVYFTVARDFVDRAPGSWWGSNAPSAASILRSQWDPVRRHWSCPSLWLAHGNILVPDATAPSGYSPLAVGEEIDALAVGRSDGQIGAPTFVLFSTNLVVPADDAPTKAPDQLMLSEPGALGTLGVPVRTAILSVPISGGTTSKASDTTGVGPNDDIDACSTWDPCMQVGSSATPRNIFDRRIGVLQDPPPFALFGWPIGSGSVYRHTAAGSDQLTAVSTRNNGLLAVLFLAPDVTNPLTVVPGPVVPMTPTGVAQFAVTIPVIPLGFQVMVHQLTLGPLSALDRSTSVIRL